MKAIAKNYSSTYLYSKGEYERNLISFLIKSGVVDKTSESFQDIVYEVKKRQETTSLVNVLLRNDVVLVYNPGNAAPRTFKVFTASDIKNGNKNIKKIYIDVTDIFDIEGHNYKCKKVDVLIAHLISAMNQIIYYKAPERIVNNSNILNHGTEAFVDMFNYVLGFLRVNSYYGIGRDRILYLIALYYQICIMGKDPTDSVKNLARKVSKISAKDAEVVDILWKDEDMQNINTFITALSRITKSEELTTELFIDKWIYLFGVSTVFAPELYTAFATALTDCYSGTYINNLKTIEKVCGNSMLDFTNALFKIGSESI